MPDVPPLPDPEPTNAERVNAQAQEIASKVDLLYRTTISGYRNGPVRRGTLFVLCAVGIAIGWPALALVALLLLALTDQVVPL
jgi:hypothetical protein